MSRHIAIRFAPVAGTGAGLGRTEAGHSVIADRPKARAGGTGLGLNGGELLAAALGGCFWNDLHYMAETLGAPVTVGAVDADVELAGTPPRIVRARISARLGGADAATRKAVFDGACSDSTVANSLTGALAITFDLLPTGESA